MLTLVTDTGKQQQYDVDLLCCTLQLGVDCHYILVMNLPCDYLTPSCLGRLSSYKSAFA